MTKSAITNSFANGVFLTQKRDCGNAFTVVYQRTVTLSKPKNAAASSSVARVGAIGAIAPHWPEKYAK